MSGCLAALALFSILGIGGCVFIMFKGAEAVDQTIREVDQVRQNLEAEARAEASQIEVVAARLTARKEPSYGSRNELTITLKNNGTKPLTSCSMTCRLKQPDRLVPLAEGEEYLSIPGGLNPGEEKEFIENIYDGPLSYADIPEGTVVEVVVDRVNWYTEEETQR